MPPRSRASGPTAPFKPKARSRILCISGPNLQLLGARQPSEYGSESLAAIHSRLKARAATLSCAVDAKQTNHEGQIVDWVGAALGKYDGLILNPAAYTHTSIAIFDALLAVGLPCVEVHLSNPDAREPFRRTSVIAPACLGRVAGFRGDSYLIALEGLALHLDRRAGQSPSA